MRGRRRTWLMVAILIAVAFVRSGLGEDSPRPPGAEARDAAEAQVAAPSKPASAPLLQPPSQAPLLHQAAHEDGDSWRDTAGTEYRLRLVNAPEQDERFGAEATAEHRRQLAAASGPTSTPSTHTDAPSPR